MKCLYLFMFSLYRTIIVAQLAMFILPTSGCAQNISKKTQRLDIQNMFIASGWMGDGEYGREYIDFDGVYEINPHSAPDSIRIAYTFGPKTWAGFYWQNKPDNWGDKPGGNYSKKGFKKITFWARGETGKEIVEFKAGDINNSEKKYRDSFDATIGRIRLSKSWKQYEIDIENADLSSIIGGFCWVASKNYNKKNKIVFYIDDIYYE